MVTARGRPSGTATTRTVTPMMKNLTKYWMYIGVHSGNHVRPAARIRHRVQVNLNINIVKRIVSFVQTFNDKRVDDEVQH